MTALEILLGVAGVVVTALVVAAMILLTPRGQVELEGDPRESQGEELSRSQPRDATADVPAPS